MTNIFIQGMAKLPVTASRWLQPVWTCVTVTLVNNPPICCGLINIWCSVEWISGGLPHCPCWFEPQQKTWPEAEHIQIYHHIELSSFTTCHLMAVKLKQYFGEGREARSGHPFFFSKFRTIFNWAVKSDPGLLWFHFTMLCDWSRKPARLSEQLKFKTWSVVFSSISSRFPALYFEFKLVHDANLSKFKTWSAVFSSTSSRFPALYFEFRLVHDANLCSNRWFWLLSFLFFDTQ